MKKVVITGIGIVSPIGIGREEFWRNLLAGETGVGPITRFDASSFPNGYAAEVADDAGWLDYLTEKQQKYFGRSAQFGVAGAKLALKDAGLTEIDSRRTDVLVGCAMTSFTAVEEAAIKSPSSGEHYEKGLLNIGKTYQTVTYSPASSIALMAGAEGYVSTISSSCVSGLNAVGIAMERIQDNRAKVVITGAVEAPISRTILRALTDVGLVDHNQQIDPSEVLCPFDKRRTKSLLGEGAAILILEEEKYAKARGARIYARAEGFAQGTENINELFMLDKSAKSWSKIIERVTGRKRVDHICAHAPSDQVLDKTECAAVSDVIGRLSARRTSITSIKGALGSAFAAAGAFQVAAAALTMFTKQIPPSYNYRIHDPDCDMDVTTKKQTRKRLKRVLVNGHGMGGYNSAIMLRAVKRGLL